MEVMKKLQKYFAFYVIRKGGEKMEERIRCLAKKYNKKDKLIKIMFQIGMSDGDTLEETQKLIEDFYSREHN